MRAGALRAQNEGIVALRDQSGNDFTWFASGYKTYKAGDVLGGKATIKKHDNYNGRPQTILTRCAFEIKPAEVKATIDACA